MTVLLLFLLSSCMGGGVTAFFGDRDGDLADERIEELFQAIKEQDEAAIMAAFSSKALAETEDMDAGVDHLLSFVQGEAVSWERDGSPVVFDSVEYGASTKQLVTWYTLETDEESYLVFLLDYPVDTIDPENAGSYSLRIIKAEDEDQLEGTWEDWAVAGICVPEQEL